MIDGRRIITAIISVFVAAVSVYADMTPVSQSDAKCVQSSHACSLTELQYTNLSSQSIFPIVAALDSWSVEFLPEANADVSQTSEIQHPQSLTNGPGSFNLCLSALIGLGLCSSAHWVKSLSFSFVPEWYHNGGPFQIGHSYAVMPESLCPAPVYCFIQPVCTVEGLIKQYRLGTVVSLWRKSQFTPAVIAPRGTSSFLTGKFFPRVLAPYCSIKPCTMVMERCGPSGNTGCAGVINVLKVLLDRTKDLFVLTLRTSQEGEIK